MPENVCWMNVESAVTRGTKDKCSPSSRSLWLNVGSGLCLHNTLHTLCCDSCSISAFFIRPQLPEFRKRHLRCLESSRPQMMFSTGKTLAGQVKSNPFIGWLSTPWEAVSTVKWCLWNLAKQNHGYECSSSQDWFFHSPQVSLWNQSGGEAVYPSQSLGLIKLGTLKK